MKHIFIMTLGEYKYCVMYEWEWNESERERKTNQK